MAKIVLKNVAKVFGDDVVAVDDVSMTIADGELVVLVGPSGSGKSTTLRIIAGLESPTNGDIHIGSELVTDTQPQNRDIAMVFQSFALYPHRSVRGNIAFPLEAQGVDGDDRDQRIDDAAELLDIVELLDRKPAQLSGGQQQRVALGRAIVRDPQAFLMDEPLANLDAKLRKEMRREVVLLQQNLETTMIHVTHNQEEAMTMGDRIAVMNEGRIQQFAPPNETYRQPANRFVAEFIGSPAMNTVEGRVKDSTFEASHADVTVPLSGVLPESISGDVTLGIRPEHVELAVNRTDVNGNITFTDEVTVVENLGNVAVAYFDFGTFEFLAELDPEDAVTAGDTVSVRLPSQYIHLFDGIDQEAERIKCERIETTT